MIAIKINCTKIEKERLFKGAKGTYLDAVLFESDDDKYGNDYVIKQSVSKEERLQGVKGAIIGNGKNIGGGGPQKAAPLPAPDAKAKPPPPGNDDDVPFNEAEATPP